MWTIFIQIILCLPLPALPMSGTFETPHIDKIAHIIIFGVFVALWCLYFSAQNLTSRQCRVIFFFVFLIAMVNGIAIEYIQLYFIPNRDFDQGDIIADLISAGISYGICNVRLIRDEWKNVPPK